MSQTRNWTDGGHGGSRPPDKKESGGKTMKKRVLSVLLTVGACLCLFVGIGGVVYAKTTLKEIKAYLNYEIAIKLDGEEQTMYDANGNRVYPVTYNGTTYVPIRAVSNMLGIAVDWDGATKSVLLGDHAALKTKLTDLSYYDRKAVYGQRYRKMNSATDNLGNSYVDPLCVVEGTGTKGYWETYLLTQDYTTFSGTLFIDYDDRDSPSTCNVRIYGDGVLLYDSPVLTKGVRPVDFSVNIQGVDELKIESNFEYSKYTMSVYIGNGVLE